jgi:hypothetical protein
MMGGATERTFGSSSSTSRAWAGGPEEACQHSRADASTGEPLPHLLAKRLDLSFPQRLAVPQLCYLLFERTRSTIHGKRQGA